jgi:hypothetical protein
MRCILSASVVSAFVSFALWGCPVVAGGQQPPAQQKPVKPDTTKGSGATAKPGDQKTAAQPDGKPKDATQDGGAAAKPGDQQTSTTKPVDLALSDVNCLHFVKTAEQKETTQARIRGYCRLGDTMVLTFSNLTEWKNDASAKGNDPASLMLVLNGRLMKGLPARGPSQPIVSGASNAAMQPGANQVFYDLKYLDLVQDDQDSSDNRNAWTALFGRSKGSIKLAVSVAAGGKPPYIGSRTVTFQVLSPGEAWAATLIFLGLLASFLLLAKFTDILRDGPSAQPAPGAPSPPKMTYSLARCQMAWWFFLVVGAFLYIWLVLGDWNSLTPSVLTLIGISAATGFSSFLVDSNKSDQRNALTSEQQDVKSAVDTLAAKANPTPAEQADLQQKQKRLADVKTALASLPSGIGESDNFVVDILRDETGISFHRFQMVAWTIILGFVFVVTVYRTLAMPEFSATLLGLMGISAGTYVGFKIPNPPKSS